MTVTVSTPDSRAARLDREADARRSGIELALLAAAAAIVAAAVGHVWLAQASRAGAAQGEIAAGRAVVLGTDTRPEQLLPLLTWIERDAERRFVARAVTDALAVDGSDAIAPLSHIGALARIRVDARAIDRRRDLAALAARLDDMRRGRMSPSSIRLLDASDLRALRPAVIVRTARTFGWRLGLSAFLLLAAFFAAHVVRRGLGVTNDPVILPIVLLLCGLGFVTMASVNDPVRDRLLFESFAWGAAFGSLLLAAASAIDFRRVGVDRFAFVFLALALLVSTLLLTFGSGPGTSGVKVNLFGVQPVEAIRPLVALFLAGYFAKRWEVVRELSEPRADASPLLRRAAPPRWVDLQPVVAGMAFVLVFFFLQRDLGPALVMSLVFLAIVQRRARPVAARARGTRGRGRRLCGGLLRGLPLHGRQTGRHVALAVGQRDQRRRPGRAGALGAGVGRLRRQRSRRERRRATFRRARTISCSRASARTSASWASPRCSSCSPSSSSDCSGGHPDTDDAYAALVIVGLVTSLVAQFLLIAAGLLGLAPLSGVVTPFLSLGRSSMLSNLAVVGALLAAARLATPGRTRPFARPVGVLTGVFLAALAALGRARLRGAGRRPHHHDGPARPYAPGRRCAALPGQSASARGRAVAGPRRDRRPERAAPRDE